MKVMAASREPPTIIWNLSWPASYGELYVSLQHNGVLCMCPQTFALSTRLNALATSSQKTGWQWQYSLRIYQTICRNNTALCAVLLYTQICKIMYSNVCAYCSYSPIFQVAARSNVISLASGGKSCKRGSRDEKSPHKRGVVLVSENSSNSKVLLTWSLILFCTTTKWRG